MSLFKPEELFDRLRGGNTLVTGNSRLARVLAGQYSQWCISRGEQQWASPSIVSWNAWLGRLWEQASLENVEGTRLAVPSPRQLLSLWEHVLNASDNTGQLLRPESLAHQAMDTRSLAVNWKLDLNHPAWRADDDNENYRAFAQWNRSFEDLCQKNGWLPPEDRSDVLALALRNGTLNLAGAIDLLGFDEFTPVQQDLLEALQQAGITLTKAVLEPAAGNAVLWKSSNAQDELRGMARWVRHCFESEPDARIAVVVPELTSRRSEVDHHLAEILMPGTRRAGAHTRPWNISLGAPLARTPLVENAFDLLKMLEQRIDIQDVGRVLRSPWIRGGVAERGQRALLEKCLREKYPRQFRLGEVRYRAGEMRKYDHDRRELPQDQWEARPWNSPQMAQLANTLMTFSRDNTAPRKASAWAESFDGLLSSLGWPLAAESEGANIPAAEHDYNWQAFQAWQDALRELASLDATVQNISRGQAIAQLKRICQEQVFQPRTPPAAIQVLGLYEANGLRFDHLWVLGLHSDNWPPAARPNPFIPRVLQREAGLPHSSPQRELEVAQGITQRLLETASNAVFSFPGQIDGEEVLPSPLLTSAGLVMQDKMPIWEGKSWTQAVFEVAGAQTAKLDMPGRLSRHTARGGTSILKNQALCPFRAFASNRLGADGLETPVDGISAMLHGSLMHAVLENFWRETRTQKALLELSPVELSNRLQQHIDAVLDEERGLLFRPEFRSVEASRLLRLAMKYLEMDKTRGDFEVEGFEREILHEIEGQTIRLIIDRVDRLPGGGQAIIDYKTGRVDPKKWFGERPEDPQLPLYAISAEIVPNAVVFAVIRDDECLYKGVVNAAGLFPGLPPRRMASTEHLIEAGENLPDTISQWKGVLHGLMSDFLAGHAAIDPKDGDKTCSKSYCELHSLCRVGELEYLEHQA